MEMSARRPPLATKPDQAVHRQPVRVSKRKPAKYNDNESFTLGERPVPSLYSLLVSVANTGQQEVLPGRFFSGICRCSGANDKMLHAIIDRDNDISGMIVTTQRVRPGLARAHEAGAPSRGGIQDLVTATMRSARALTNAASTTIPGQPLFISGQNCVLVLTFGHSRTAHFCSQCETDFQTITVRSSGLHTFAKTVMSHFDFPCWPVVVCHVADI